VSAVRPVSGVDYPATFQQLQEWFAEEASCVEYLARLRWPEGFVCPACDKREAWRTSEGLWMCVGCGRRTSVTAGTIFHRTRLPLRTWFAAVWFVTSQKNGVSALGLQRVLGFGSYETAWAWLHKLRRAMVRPDRDRLGGTVEVDETYLGGRDAGSDGRGTAKDLVVIAIESQTQPRKLGRVRLANVPDASTPALCGFIERVVEPGATIHTDGLGAYRDIAQRGYRHHATSLIASPDPAHITMPGVHRVASLLKRWIAGTLHYGISTKHLDYYLDEFTFRFNRRTSTSRGLLFYRLLEQAVATQPHPLDVLTADWLWDWPEDDDPWNDFT
jgi:transposase-like protein